MKFSERYKIVEVNEIIQRQSMNYDLRNSIWNALTIYIWNKVKEPRLERNYAIHSYFRVLWANFFKFTLDTLDIWWKDCNFELRKIFFSMEWYEIYDFLEFTAEHFPGDGKDDFIKYCNYVLERELSAYRFIGDTITEITDKNEIESISEAVSNSDINVRKHFETALVLISDKSKPDYRNSIKESISAVEAMCKKISNSSKSTLGDALNVLEKEGSMELHKALKDGFSKLYGYTNDANGIRHSLSDEKEVSFEDAKFMLVSCTSFVNYLRVKSDKAGIKIT